MSIEDSIKESLAAEGIDASEALEKAHEVTEVSHTDTSREYTEFEQEQMAKGWKPDGVKSAEEYARTEPLYEEIKARGKQLKQMQKAIESLTEHMTKQEKLAYEKALETLRQEKNDAIYRGDVQAVAQIEQEQHRLTTPPPVRVPEADAFTEKYEKLFKSSGFEEMEIVKFIEQRDIDLMARKLSPAEHMAMLEDHMLKKFPHYFGGSKETVDRASHGVETGQGSNVARKSTRTKYTFNDLSPEQRQVARDFEKFGIMKVDDYIKQLVELKELK